VVEFATNHKLSCLVTERFKAAEDDSRRSRKIVAWNCEF